MPAIEIHPGQRPGIAFATAKRVGTVVPGGALATAGAGLWLLYLSLFFAVTSAGEYVKLFLEAIEAKDRRIKSGGAA